MLADFGVDLPQPDIEIDDNLSDASTPSVEEKTTGLSGDVASDLQPMSPEPIRTAINTRRSSRRHAKEKEEDNDDERHIEDELCVSV
jgi:hypothetical protein